MAPRPPKLVLFSYHGSSLKQIMLSSSSTLKLVVYKLHCLLVLVAITAVQLPGKRMEGEDTTNV